MATSPTRRLTLLLIVCSFTAAIVIGCTAAQQGQVQNAVQTAQAATTQPSQGTQELATAFQTGASLGVSIATGNPAAAKGAGDLAYGLTVLGGALVAGLSALFGHKQGAAAAAQGAAAATPDVVAAPPPPPKLNTSGTVTVADIKG